MVLRDSKHGKFYGCSTFPQCRGTHGAHADGRPLGTPANKETKEARMRAHEAFDQLWRSGRMNRSQAYSWMQRVMSMTKDEAHIGKFSAEQCDKLIELVSWELRI